MRAMTITRYDYPEKVGKNGKITAPARHYTYFICGGKELAQYHSNGKFLLLNSECIPAYPRKTLIARALMSEYSEEYKHIFSLVDEPDVTMDEYEF